MHRVKPICGPCYINTVPSASECRRGASQIRVALDGNKHIFRCQRAGQAKCMLGCEIKSDGRADATLSSYSAQAVSHLLFQGGSTRRMCSPKREVFCCILFSPLSADLVVVLGGGGVAAGPQSGRIILRVWIPMVGMFVLCLLFPSPRDLQQPRTLLKGH